MAKSIESELSDMEAWVESKINVCCVYFSTFEYVVFNHSHQTTYSNGMKSSCVFKAH